jgi:hypothetical protein
MSTFASLVSVHLEGEGKEEISLDTLPGKFTITRTDEALIALRRAGRVERLSQASRDHRTPR